MSIPGFAAEASLYKPSQQYRAVEPFVRHANGVRTQLIIPVKPPGAQNVPESISLATQIVSLHAAHQINFSRAATPLLIVLVVVVV